MDIITILWKPDTDGAPISSIINNVKVICSTLEEVKEYILTLEDEQHVLLVAHRIIALSGELITLRESLEKKTTSVITTVLIDVLGESIDEYTPYGPLDTLLKFDFTLSKRGIYVSSYLSHLQAVTNMYGGDEWSDLRTVNWAKYESNT